MKKVFSVYTNHNAPIKVNIPNFSKIENRETKAKFPSPPYLIGFNSIDSFWYAIQ